MSDFDIKTTVALVTGSNRGIGRAITTALLDAGAARVYAGARDPKTVQDLVETYGERVTPIELDVTDDAQVDDAAKAASDVNLLINNAGVLTEASGLNDTALDDARFEMEVNYLGLIRVTRTFAPVLKTNGGGTVVNVASIASHLTFPMIVTYSASKAAVHALSQGLRVHLAAQNTRLVTLHPGPIETDMTDDLDFETTPPSVVADELLKGLADPSVEAVYPDAMARELYQQWQSDPVAAQKEASAMAEEA